MYIEVNIQLYNLTTQSSTTIVKLSNMVRNNIYNLPTTMTTYSSLQKLKLENSIYIPT